MQRFITLLGLSSIDYSTVMGETWKRRDNSYSWCNANRSLFRSHSLSLWFVCNGLEYCEADSPGPGLLISESHGHLGGQLGPLFRRNQDS